MNVILLEKILFTVGNGMKINYQKELEKTLQKLQDEEKRPVLVLHCCCAPCSTYVLKYLAQYFTIKILFYNPNISPKAEYDRRLDELHSLLNQMQREKEIEVIETEYHPEEFYHCASGLENEPEGGARCKKCFELRLEEAAHKAAELDADYFTTTLTISPHKDANLLNEIGQLLGEKYHIPYLCSDFKKKEGFKQSLVLSEQYELYRQDYCGCIFSKKEREQQRKEAEDKTDF